MKIHVTMSRDELLDAIGEIEKHIASRARIQPSTWEAMLLWIPAGIALAYVLDTHDGRAALAMIVAVVVLVWGTNYLAARGKRRLNDYLVKDLTSSNVEFEFLDSHINLKTAHSSGKIDWRIVKEVVESDGFVFLYIDNSHAYVIPKRIFESTAIYELAKSKVESSAC